MRTNLKILILLLLVFCKNPTENNLGTDIYVKLPRDVTLVSNLEIRSNDKKIGYVKEFLSNQNAFYAKCMINPTVHIPKHSAFRISENLLQGKFILVEFAPSDESLLQENDTVVAEYFKYNPSTRIGEYSKADSITLQKADSLLLLLENL